MVGLVLSWVPPSRPRRPCFRPLRATASHAGTRRSTTGRMVLCMSLVRYQQSGSGDHKWMGDTLGEELYGVVYVCTYVYVCVFYGVYARM